MDDIEKYDMEDDIFARVSFAKIIKYWYLYVIFLFLALIMAFFYQRYQKPVYEAYTTMFIKGRQMDLDQMNIISGVSGGNFATNDITKELTILQSYAMKERTLKNLDFTVTYLCDFKCNTYDIYKNNPFVVEIDKSQLQMTGSKYELQFIDDETFTLSTEADVINMFDLANNVQVSHSEESVKLSGTYKFNQWIDNKYNRIRIRKTNKFTQETTELKYGFIINDMTSAIKQNGNIVIDYDTKQQSNVITIRIAGNNQRKCVDYLNALTNEFIRHELEIKNEIFSRTITFIDETMQSVKDSLLNSEIDVHKFQKENKIVDLDLESNRIVTDAAFWEQKLNEAKFNIEYYNILKDYITSDLDDSEKIIAPNIMNISDNVLHGLIQELIMLTDKRNASLQTTTEYSPTIQALNEQIKNTKNLLNENINNLIENTNFTIANINKTLDSIENSVAQLPETQRQLLNLKRKFVFNENLYDFLLKRRSETDLVKASNTPDSEIIDKARIETTYPINKTKRNIVVIIIMMLFIPTAYIILKIILNHNVESLADIKAATDAPIIGNIPLIKTKEGVNVVLKNPKSPTAEAFRSVRTNLDFILQGKDKGVILVTSDMVGAGKTFVSINLASIYAIFGKKTLLVGFDLRKPRLFKEFNLNNNCGISSYFTGRSNIDEIIQHVDGYSNFDIITGGPIPPNPAELIASERTHALMEELRGRYDFIIVDTAPLNFVSDTYYLLNEADAIAFVVRHNVNRRDTIGTTIDDINKRSGRNTSIIVNGITGVFGRYGHEYGYGYGYNYGYGHKKGYYEDNDKY